jgi:hypothetical protein
MIPINKALIVPEISMANPLAPLAPPPLAVDSPALVAAVALVAPALLVWDGNKVATKNASIPLKLLLKKVQTIPKPKMPLMIIILPILIPILSMQNKITTTGMPLAVVLVKPQKINPLPITTT